MKKIVICGLLAAGCCLSAAAPSDKLSPQAKLMLLDRQSAAQLRSTADTPETITAFVTLNDGEDATFLKELGLDVLYTAGQVSIVIMPVDRAEEIAEMPQVKCVAFGERSDAKMDVARRITFVDEINQGYDIDGKMMSFTGAGVVTGLYDTGLDPNHAAFRNADGSSRVKALFEARNDGNTARVTSYTTPEAIAKYTTDDEWESHGTHVAGIMAGSRNVKGRYAQTVSGQTTRTEGDIPYYGVAYNSDLVIGCGDFFDASILAGVAAVVNHAKQLGQPAVVNLSLGGNTGPHDANSQTAILLDGLSEDAMICVAAGNEGESPMAIQKNFSRMSGLNLNTFMTGATSDALPMVYSAEFWSGNATQFECSLVIYDKLDQKIVSSQKVTGNETYTASNWEALGDVFTGSVSVSSGIDKQTNRFYVVMNNNLRYNSSSTKVFGVNITGKAGEKCYAYINTYSTAPQQVFFTSQNVTGYLNGTPDGSINGFGCGKKVLSVGSYTSRTSAPYIGNGNYTGSGTIGAISSFSSYGELADGRQLPDICAPGQQIVSSISQYYYNKQKLGERVNALSTEFDHTSAYYPFQGTSMATPFAAGIVALMLEANPDLTSDEILTILRDKKYATTDAQTNGVDFKRWGAGKINAIKAVCAALGKDQIGETMADNLERNFMLEQTAARQYNVIVPGAKSVDVKLYNLQGASVMTASAAGDVAALDASSLGSGVYLLKADSDLGSVTRKIALN